MLYIIVSIILVVIAKFIYDKSQLTDHIKKGGGIKENYKALISDLSDNLSPEINEFKDHLLLNIKSDSLEFQYELIPAFDKLIIKLLLSTKNDGIFRFNWEFKETKISQKDMANVILKEIENLLEAIKMIKYYEGEEIEEIKTVLPVAQSTLEKDEDTQQMETEEKIINILSEIPHLSKKDKLELFKFVYSCCGDEEKATILNIWQQAKHNNPFIDKLSDSFDKSEQPRFIWSPNTDNVIENKKNIFNSITYVRGFDGIENFILNHIGSIKEEFEVDRLLFISFAVSSTYGEIYGDLESLTASTWLKSEQYPKHYILLLLKSKIDLLMYKSNFKEAFTLSTSLYNTLCEQYQEELPWLTYQILDTLMELNELGYINPLLALSQIEQKKKTCSENGFIDDMDDRIKLF